MTGFIFQSLKSHGYRAIIADPPWTFSTYSDKGHEKAPQAHYVCMEPEDIYRLPVASLAHPDGCLLFLWATAPMMEQAFTAIERWGFTFKTMGPWVKLSKTGNGLAFGTGFRFRSTCEFFLVATRGKVPQGARNIRNIIIAPVREHSRKPEEQYPMVEALAAGPYVELFARERTRAWDSWGNEVGKFGEPPKLSLALAGLAHSITENTKARTR